MTAEGIVTHPAKMTGQELRFPRSEMGLTPVRIAKFVEMTLPVGIRRERN